MPNPPAWAFLSLHDLTPPWGNSHGGFFLCLTFTVSAPYNSHPARLTLTLLLAVNETYGMATHSYDSIAYRILAARIHAKLTHDAVAHHLNVTRTSVSMWERGHIKSPSIEHVKLLAVLFKVPVAWLLLREGDDPPLDPLPANILQDRMARHRQVRNKKGRL